MPMTERLHEDEGNDRKTHSYIKKRHNHVIVIQVTTHYVAFVGQGNANHRKTA